MSYQQDHYKGPEVKPGELTAVAVMTLISGFTNIGAAITWSLIALSTIVGIVCIPVTILPAILGVFEIIYAINLLANPPKVKEPSQLLAIFEISMILTGNILSLVSGILALVLYNNPNVQGYFAQLRGKQ
jgi:uncharacterized membrane protein